MLALCLCHRLHATRSSILACAPRGALLCLDSRVRLFVALAPKGDFALPPFKPLLGVLQSSRCLLAGGPVLQAAGLIGGQCVRDRHPLGRLSAALEPQGRRSQAK